jgi:uncharacterized protein
MTTVTVNQLWRFPVKSMGGTPVDTLRIEHRGAHADRLWAVRDLDNEITASARKIPALLGCSARYVSEPGEDAGPGNVPAVVINFPDGSERHSSDHDVDERLSEVAGRPVRLTALPAGADTSAQRLTARQGLATFLSGDQIRQDFGLSGADRMPDISAFSLKELATLARYSTPPGTFVDLSPVHLLSTRSLTSLSADGKPLDPKRFRPNVLIDVDGSTDDYPEAGWIGARLRIGSATLRPTTPTVRCVVPTRPQPGIELDRTITRLLAERTDRFLGIYADVEAPGLLRIGDTVTVELTDPPNTLRRNAVATGKRLQQGFQRLLELTVLRSR